MPDDIVAYLLTQGVLGLAVLALGIEYVRLRKKVDELQELRYKEAKETLKEVTEVLQGNSQNMALLSEKIVSAKKGR